MTITNLPIIHIGAGVTFLLAVVLGGSFSAHAQTCGDADGNALLTVTDGVKVLRSAAGLEEQCPSARCDVDHSGTIGITDGVNVLSAAAGLPVTLTCPTDRIISSVLGENGIFGDLTKVPGGLTAPAGAPATIGDVEFDQFADGRTNTITVPYAISTAQAQGAAGSEVSLLVASSTSTDQTPEDAFVLPLDAAAASVTIALDLKPDLADTQFTLKIANAENGSVVGQVATIIIIVVGAVQPRCGNRVVDDGETCDPGGRNCAVDGVPGFCTDECQCDPFPGRFRDNGDGTVIDTNTQLQWEQKTGTIGPAIDCSRVTCSDPHDVNGTYAWCLDADHNGACDDPTGPKDGGAYEDFLKKLNTAPCFAGQCDWRLPDVNRDFGTTELETIVDLSVPGCATVPNAPPCIDPIFTPSTGNGYWSSRAVAGQPLFAWFTAFFDGVVDYQGKTVPQNVRAVRTVQAGE